MGGAATSRWVGGDRRRGEGIGGEGRGWEVLLPLGGWEGMGGAAASLGGGGVVLEQPSLSSSCLLCPERVSGPGHSAAERQRLPRVPHLRGACESPTVEGACTPPKTVSCSHMSLLLSALEAKANCSRCVLCVLRSKSSPLDQMGPLVTVDAHCCINYYTYIQYTLLYIHTVYITMHTYGIHYYAYLQYTLLCIRTVYTQCACFYTCRHALCVYNKSISTQYNAVLRTVPSVYVQNVCVECHTLVVCVV